MKIPPLPADVPFRDRASAAPEAWDLLRGRPGERPQADSNIAGLPRPAHDPIYGADGPLRQTWR